jgi:hypothetical protein
MMRTTTVRTHIGRVSAQTDADGTVSHFFVPLDAPGRRYRLTRMPYEPAGHEGEIDLRRFRGHLVSVTGLRGSEWITNVISFQATPERPAARRSTSEASVGVPALE